jgi:hypothetical protein
LMVGFCRSRPKTIIISHPLAACMHAFVHEGGVWRLPRPKRARPSSYATFRGKKPTTPTPRTTQTVAAAAKFRHFPHQTPAMPIERATTGRGG